MDFYHCEILLEWSGVQCSPVDYVGLLLVTDLINKKKWQQQELNQGPTKHH